jgi:hypothetical protein
MPDTNGKKQYLNYDGCCFIVPKPQPQLCFFRKRKRQIRSMRDHIQKPMANDKQGQEYGASAIFL